MPTQLSSAPPDSRLAVLLEVARAVNSSLELDAVLQHLLERATQLLRAESGSIMLLEEGRQLRVVAAWGPRAQLVEARVQQLGEGVAGWVAAHAEPVLLHGTLLSDRRFRPLCERVDVRDALCAPLRAEDELLGVINLSNSSGPRRFSEEDLDLLSALAALAAQAIRNARAYDEVRLQRRTVERLVEELTNAQEQERMRIALQLHDGPAQTLHAALRNLETARSLAAAEPPRPEALRAALEELERSIRHSIQTTRAVMIDLRPPAIEETGLEAALRHYVQRFQERTGIETSLAMSGQYRPLPRVIESSFYRIAQEALTNVWKHAHARHARVELLTGPGSCTLVVSDDGQGFDPRGVAASEEHHLGLRSIRERVELAGGRLAVESSPSRGTTVRVVIPLPA
jgi:two-component system NarL family sensor kinase